ncbi:MAG: NifU family protein [Kiritimatiellia bacterium]
MEDKIKVALEQLRTGLQSHGGDLELVEIAGKVVRLRLQGACRGCPHAQATIKNYIEYTLRADVDSEITVEPVND